VTWLAVAAVILMVHLLQILGNLAARKVRLVFVAFSIGG
jgi:D-methionine transport system permease protein